MVHGLLNLRERKTGGTKAWRQQNKELRARLEALEKKEWEGVQGGQGLPSGRESGLEEEWGVELNLQDEVESRKKLDEQRRKLQKELRGFEKFSCVPKEFQENVKSYLQEQLQELEQRRHDLMPEHQKAQKRSQNIQSLQKDSTAAEEEIRKLREYVKQEEE